MILWNAFYEYFLRRGNVPKKIAIGMLVALFLCRRFGLIERCKAFVRILSPLQWLVLILVLGFGLRFSWAMVSPYSPPAAGTEDMIMINHARDLVAGKGYITATGLPSANRPIGYALVLATIFKFFGENLDVVASMNVCLIFLTLWLVYMIGTTAANEFTGLGGAFLLAIYPTSILAVPVVLEEHIFIPMWLSGILLLILDYQKADWRKVFFAGALFAVAAHFRTYSFAMGLVVFFMWAFFKKDLKNAFARLIFIQTLVFLVALPWAIRNYYKMGEPIMYSTYIGGAFYYSNNPIADVRWPINPSPEQGGDVAFYNAKTEQEINRAGKAAALKWITANPMTFVQKALGRGIYNLGLTREGWLVKDNFTTPRTGRVRPPEEFIAWLDRIDNDYYGVVFLLALFGGVVFFLPHAAALRKPGFGYLLATLAYYMSIICLTLGHRKYRFVIEPLFCVLAAYGLSFFTTPPKMSKGQVVSRPTIKNERSSFKLKSSSGSGNHAGIKQLRKNKSNRLF